MVEKKREIGFQTSAKIMYDALVELRGELGKTKERWRSLATAAGRQSDLLIKKSDELKKPTAMAFAAETSFLWWIVQLIAILGEEVVDVHDRLADVEKAVKELKQRIK